MTIGDWVVANWLPILAIVWGAYVVVRVVEWRVNRRRRAQEAAAVARDLVEQARIRNVIEGTALWGSNPALWPVEVREAVES